MTGLRVAAIAGGEHLATSRARTWRSAIGEVRHCTDGAGPAGIMTDVGGAATTVVVVAGDDLWQIAARELARVSAHDGAGLDPALLAGYWRELCDTNLAALRSGDVNVIFPGEVITLPPHRAAPPTG